MSDSGDLPRPAPPSSPPPFPPSSPPLPPPPGAGPPPPGFGYPAYAPAPSQNANAIIALVLGILGLTSCYILTGIPALVLGYKARREIDDSGGRQAGRGLATAGIVLGWVSVGLTAIAVLFFVAIFAIGAATYDEDYEPYDPGSSSCYDAEGRYQEFEPGC
jgi:hypothetical protein